jgi:hypothetical protein
MLIQDILPPEQFVKLRKLQAKINRQGPPKLQTKRINVH